MLALSWRNLWHHRRRQVLAILGLGLAVAVCLSYTSAFTAVSRAYLAEVGLDGVPLLAHVEVTGPGVDAQAVADIASVDGVEGAAWIARAAVFMTRDIGLTAVRDDRGLFDLERSLLAGRLPGGPGEAAIGDFLADIMNVEVGSRLGAMHLATRTPVPLEIVGILSRLGLAPGGSLVVTPGYLAEVAGGTATDAILVRVGPGVSPRSVSSAIRAGRSWATVGPYVDDHPARAGTRTAGQQLVETLLALTYLGAGLAVLNAAYIVASFRRREVGTLYALGMAPWMVALIYFLESAYLSAIGVGLGVGLGVAAMGVLDHAVDLQFVVEWSRVARQAGIFGLVALVAGLLPYGLMVSNETPLLLLRPER